MFSMTMCVICINYSLSLRYLAWWQTQRRNTKENESEKGDGFIGTYLKFVTKKLILQERRGHNKYPFYNVPQEGLILIQNNLNCFLKECKVLGVYFL